MSVSKPDLDVWLDADFPLLRSDVCDLDLMLL